MEQTQADNHDTPANRTPKEAPPSTSKKQSRALWIIILAFIMFVVTVFLTQNRKQIDWQDYQTGIELAKQQNKPALLCFFKQHTHYSSQMWQNIYSKPDVEKYIEANFVPILIDVDKQPEIASRYNVTYYPTHYIENPKTNQIDGPFIGTHRLLDFIKRPRKYAPKSSVLR